MLQFIIINMLNNQSKILSLPLFKSSSAHDLGLGFSASENTPIFKDLIKLTLQDILQNHLQQDGSTDVNIRNIEKKDQNLAIGIYSRRYNPNSTLQEVLRDLIYPQEVVFENIKNLKMSIRIEVYAPLSADPMQQRRNKDKAKSKNNSP